MSETWLAPLSSARALGTVRLRTNYGLFTWAKNRPRIRTLRTNVEHVAPPGSRVSGTVGNAAVLILVVSDAVFGPTVLATVRSADLSSHAGHVSLPGGRSDPGEDAITTALRETEEEVGIAPSSVRVHATLSPVRSLNNLSVTPVVGTLARDDEQPQLVDPHASIVDYNGLALKPSPTEVARVLRVPLAALREPVRYEQLAARGRTPVYT
eukprot:CAMPEP_0170749130 /NCGR_PEP_ID=MMETSP0437-20130122/10233_1 /TAXON_ID=0 /ORGANISM="Sexangularia sp." /LENGTH=209 /DNA_ID=CAMNT_0011088037 /DNA_START=206 /DNA_END=832 /DNA_ORIENTATION=+